MPIRLASCSAVSWSSEIKVKRINVFSKKLGAVASSSKIVEEVTESEIEVVRKFNRKFGERGAALNRMIALLDLGEASIDELVGRLLETVEQLDAVEAEARPALINKWKEKGRAYQLEHNPDDREGVFRFVIDGVGTDFAEAGFKYSKMNDNHAGLATPARIVELLKTKPGRARVLHSGAGKAKAPVYLVLVEQGIVNETTWSALTGEGPASAEHVVPPRRSSNMGFKVPAATSRSDDTSSGS